MRVTSSEGRDRRKRTDLGCVLDVESTRLALHTKVLLYEAQDSRPRTSHRC